MKKLALVVPALGLGGGVPAVARFIANAALGDGRFDVQLVSLSSSARDPESLRLLAPSSWVRGVRTRDGTWGELPYTQIGVMGAELEFQRYSPRRALSEVLLDCDVIQVVCGSPAWANAVIGLGKPVALHVATRARVERRQRDGSPRGLVGWWRKAMTGITDRLDDKALQRVDSIQVMNPWMFDYARQVNAGRDVELRYAPPGVDAGLFHPLADRDPMRLPYILCVGRLADPRKRIELLLEACAGLPDSLRNGIRLVLAGSSPPSDGFWRLADDLGLRERVTYVERPETDHLVRLYQGASVFVLASDEEGFGVVVIEAMACGIPVVATRCGGPDGIIADGKDGYLVPPGDAAALSSRLRQLLEDQGLNVRMGRQARRTIEQRYDARIVGPAFADTWERMTTDGRASRCAG